MLNVSSIDQREFAGYSGGKGPMASVHSVSRAPETGEKRDGRSVSDGKSPGSNESQGQVNRLKRREAEVRRHEQAHISAGGPYIQGGPRYTYQQGPDGRAYIAGGEVSIDVSPASDNPEATLEKMQVVRRAAMAPSDPSPQDRAVSAKADQMATRAKVELSEQRSSEDGDGPQGITPSAQKSLAAGYGRESDLGSGRGKQLDIFV